MSSVILNAGEVVRKDIFLIDPTEIVIGKNSRWRQFDEEHVTWLVNDFELHGQETEVTIRKVADNKVQLVAGFNRHEGMLRYNKLHPENPMKLRCRLVNCNEEEGYRKSITENESRMDTTPIDKAHAQNELRERYGWSEEKIKDLYGCSKAYCHMLKKLLALPYETQLLVHKPNKDGERLSINAALDLAGLSAEKQAEVMADVSAEPVQEVAPPEISTFITDVISDTTFETVIESSIDPTKFFNEPSAAPEASATAQPTTEPTKRPNISQRVSSAVREKKIEAGGKQPRTLSEITGFWRKLETDSTLLIAISALVLQFHDGSITENKFKSSMEDLT